MGLVSLTGLDAVGRPFGEGNGLEEATSLLSESFDNADSMRSASGMLAVRLLTEGAEDGVGPDDLDNVMGVGGASDSELSEPQANAAGRLADAAKAFLAQYSRDGDNTWAVWEETDDVTGELLCWHVIAWQRLAAVGRVPAIQTFGR